MSSSIQEEEEKARPPRFPFSVLPFLPQHLPLSKERTYLGLRRNTFLLVLLGASLSLLILILGLSIGLASKKQFVPPPHLLLPDLTNTHTQRLLILHPLPVQQSAANR